MGIVIMALKPLACESTAWRGRQVVSGELLSCGRFRYTRSRSVRCLFRRSDDRNRHYLPTRTDSHTATNKEPQEIILEINNHPRDQQPSSRSTTIPEINNQPPDQQPSPRSTTNPKNTPAEQHQPKPTNTTVLHFKTAPGLSHDRVTIGSPQPQPHRAGYRGCAPIRYVPPCCALRWSRHPARLLCPQKQPARTPPTPAVSRPE